MSQKCPERPSFKKVCAKIEPWPKGLSVKEAEEKIMKVIDFKQGSVDRSVEKMRTFIFEKSAVPVKSEPIEDGVRLWYRNATDIDANTGPQKSHYA